MRGATVLETARFGATLPHLAPLITIATATTTPARGGEVRRFTAPPGLTLETVVVTDASTGTAGMASAGAVRAHSIVSLTLVLDSLIGWQGLTLFAQHKMKQGRNGSGEAAFIQNYSNIDADDFRALGEVYIEQRVLQDRLRIKLGRLDFNSEFAGTDNGANFLNASMGYSPSITAAPTFPLPTGAASVFLAPLAHLSIGAGVFDGMGSAPAPNGGRSLFTILQVNEQWGLLAGRLPGRVGVGAFRHSGGFPALVPPADNIDALLTAARGWYATVDQTLWRAAAESDDALSPNIAAFAQLGRSDHHVSPVQSHVGGGFTLAGVMPGARASVVGLGATRATMRDGNESIGELFYQLPIVGSLALVADVQRVVRRLGTAPERGTVFTLRTMVSF